MTMRRHENAGSELFVDDTHAPLMIATWIGEPTLPLVEAYQQWLVEQVGRAQSGNYRLVLMSDSTLTELPSGAARKALSEDRTQSDDVVIKPVVVITSSVIRGALTAIKWLVGERFGDVEVRDSTSEGIARCLEVLDQHGIERPNLSPTSYVFPTASASLRAKTS